MKRVFVRLLIFLVVLAAASWAMYPFVSNTVAQGNVTALMERYHRTVREMTPEQTEKILQDTMDYNEGLSNEKIPDVFSGKSLKAPGSYQSLMNIQEGVIGELVIPAISVSLPIYHSGSESDPDKQVVHIVGSALPTDQDGIHTVLAGPGIQKADGFPGSLQLTDARMLEDLDRIIPRDLIFLNVLDRTFIYQVEGVITLASEGLAGESMAGDEEAQLLTILTERKGRRLLIRARRVEAASVQEQLMEEDRAEIPADVVNILVLGIPVLLLGSIITTVVDRFKKRSYRLPTEQKYRKREDPENIPEEDDSGDKKAER